MKRKSLACVPQKCEPESSMDLGETVPSVCSGTCLTVSADGSEGSDMRAEEVLHTQEEEDHLAVALPAVKAADKETEHNKTNIVTRTEQY
jgi:hypothetical protein